MNRPFSAKQELAFINSNSLINIAEGAVSSGKSYIYDYTFLDFLRKGPNGPDGEDGEYLISGKSEGSIIRNILSPIEKEFDINLNYNHSQRYFNLWNKKVYVIGANDERAGKEGTEKFSVNADSVPIRLIECYTKWVIE